MTELKEWKIEVKIYSSTKPNKKEIYEVIKTLSHKKINYAIQRLSPEWVSVTQVKSVLDITKMNSLLDSYNVMGKKK